MESNLLDLIKMLLNSNEEFSKSKETKNGLPLTVINFPKKNIRVLFDLNGNFQSIENTKL